MLNMLEKMWKREYKIGTRKHEGYVVQSNGLHSWRKLLWSTSLLYKSVIRIRNYKMGIYSRQNPRLTIH